MVYLDIGVLWSCLNEWGRCEYMDIEWFLKYI